MPSSLPDAADDADDADHAHAPAVAPAATTAAPSSHTPRLVAGQSHRRVGTIATAEYLPAHGKGKSSRNARLNAKESAAAARRTARRASNVRLWTAIKSPSPVLPPPASSVSEYCLD